MGASVEGGPLTRGQKGVLQAAELAVGDGEGATVPASGAGVIVGMSDRKAGLGVPRDGEVGLGRNPLGVLVGEAETNVGSGGIVAGATVLVTTSVAIKTVGLGVPAFKPRLIPRGFTFIKPETAT